MTSMHILRWFEGVNSLKTRFFRQRIKYPASSIQEQNQTNYYKLQTRSQSTVAGKTTSLTTNRTSKKFLTKQRVCSLVGFSQPKPASQQCFSLTINQHQPAQTSPETNQRTGRLFLETHSICGFIESQVLDCYSLFFCLRVPLGLGNPYLQDVSVDRQERFVSVYYWLSVFICLN